MRIAGFVQDSIVDGPGLRFTVFTQGCVHRCEGCHNSGTWELSGGSESEPDEVIRKMLSNPLTDGLTLSGGEPFCQASDCAKIAAAAHSAGLNVWTYTGWTFEELSQLAESDADIGRLLRLTDVLVDGRFVLAERSMNLKWRGSANQRILDVAQSIEAGKAVLYT